MLFMRWGIPTKTIATDSGNIYLWLDAAPARECRVEFQAVEIVEGVAVPKVNAPPAVTTSAAKPSASQPLKPLSLWAWRESSHERARCNGRTAA